MAWDAYNNIAVFTEDINTINNLIGKTGIITPDDLNGIFGKLMSVSLVAHNAFDNNVYLTGQFNNLSMSYYNISTVNLSLNLWNTTTSIDYF